jgi:uncharacterized membrane protein YjfL (UPF0719 family)
MSDLLHPLVLGLQLDIDSMVAALIYSVLGLALFAIFWLIVVRVTPFSLRKEIEDDQNTALGIILGAMIIGISMIIAAAVGG